MGKPATSLASKIQPFLKKYNWLEFNNSISRCTLCDDVLSLTDSHVKDRIDRHILNSKHQTQIQKQTKKQPSSNSLIQKIQNKTTKQQEFCQDLTKMYVEMGIPLFKLQHPAFKAFCNKYIPTKKIPDRTSLRKTYIPKLYNETMDKIKETIGTSDVYLILDETTDVNSKLVLNILVGKLDGEETKSMLFHVSFLEATNWETVAVQFHDCIAKLWPDIPPSQSHTKIRLVLTDQASYMIKAFKTLKKSGTFSNLHHITCIVHSIHLAAETIRKENPLIDELILNMKKALLKSPKRINLFRNVAKIPLPPKPVLTRWGTWLEAAIFYSNHYTEVMDFILQLALMKDKETKSITLLKKLLNNKKLHDDLLEMKKHKVLIANLKELESQNLPVKKQISLLQEILAYLNGSALKKLMLSLIKNPDLFKFLDSEKDFKHKSSIELAPLVSVDCERSFSKYKHLLETNRQSLNEESIVMLMVINCNAFLNEK